MRWGGAVFQPKLKCWLQVQRSILQPCGVVQVQESAARDGEAWCWRRCSILTHDVGVVHVQQSASAGAEACVCRCSSGLAPAGTACAVSAAVSSSNVNSGPGGNREGSAAKMRYQTETVGLVGTEDGSAAAICYGLAPFGAAPADAGAHVLTESAVLVLAGSIWNSLTRTASVTGAQVGEMTQRST